MQQHERIAMNHRIDESEFIFTLEGLACEVGMSVATFKRRLKTLSISLSKWGNGKTSSVYVSKHAVFLLKRRLLSSKM